METLAYLYWPVLLLLCMACYGLGNHILTTLAFERDIEAMVRLGRNGYLLRGVRDDVKDESYRVIAKSIIVLGYAIMFFTDSYPFPREGLGAGLSLGMQAATLFFLTASSHTRRLSRQRMVAAALAQRARDALDAKGRQRDGF